MQTVFRQQTERIHVEIRFDHHAKRPSRLHEAFSRHGAPRPAGGAFLGEKRGTERGGEEEELFRDFLGVSDAGDARDLQQLSLRRAERSDVVGSAGNHVPQAEEKGERSRRIARCDVRMQQQPGLVAVALHQELVARRGDREFGGGIRAQKLAAQKTVADLRYGGRLRVAAARRRKGVGDRVQQKGVVVVVAVLAVEHRIAHFVLVLLRKIPLAVVSAVQTLLQAGKQSAAPTS